MKEIPDSLYMAINEAIEEETATWETTSDMGCDATESFYIEVEENGVNIAVGLEYEVFKTRDSEGDGYMSRRVYRCTLGRLKDMSVECYDENHYVDEKKIVA